MSRFGLIGKKLSHSFSKDYFGKKFAEEGLDHEYLNFELSSIAECDAVFQLEGIIGLNVTVPYKESIIPFLD